MQRVAIWVGVLACLLPAASFADDQHYQDFIVGDEAVGLGGAYTAIASDPSGGWYNPAGIVDVRNMSLSLTANLYGIQDNSTGEGAFLDPENAISKLSIVPSSAGFVQSLGRADVNGRRTFAVGMTLVVPSYRKFSITEEKDYQGVHSGYNRSFTDSTLWVGLFGAMRLGGRFSIGLGVFLMQRSVQDSAFSYVATDLVNGEYQTFRSAMTELDFSNYSLVGSLGIKWEIARNFFFGAMVRSPSLPLYSTGKVRFARAWAPPGGQASFLPTPEQVSVNSETRINGEARAGIAYVIPDLLKVAADVSAHMPVSYDLVNIDDQVPEDALLIPYHIERDLVINGNLGVEVTIIRKISIGVGGFTNFSSVYSVPDDRPSPASVHMFGGCLAVGYASDHTVTRAGLMYSYGEGKDVHAVTDPSQLDNDSQGFERVDLTQSYMYFFLSSTFRY